MKITFKYIAAMSIFILYLIFANSILTMNSGLKKVNFSLLQSNAPVYYDINVVEELGDIMETVSTEGWAFCETTLDNTNKTISVVLKGKNNSYMVENRSVLRRDVKGAFPDKKIGSQYCGLSAEFSTVNIKPGRYTLFLYVKENESDYGIVNTHQVYEKKGKRFTPYIPRRIENIPAVIPVQDMKCDVQITIDNNRLKISGWAFLEGEDATDQNVYMLINLPNGDVLTHETARIMRNDVGNHFNDMKYSNSGFEVEIDMAKYDLEGADVKIIIDNNGLFVSETSVLLEF